MFRPVPMVHLQVQIPIRDGPAVTRRIAAQGLLHLIDIGHGTSQSRVPSATREWLARYRDLARTVRRLAASMAVPELVAVADVDGEQVTDFATEFDLVRRQIEPIRARVDEALACIATAQEDARHASEQRARARTVEAAALDVGRLRALRFAAVRFGTASTDTFASIADALTPDAFAILPLAGAADLTAIATAAGGRERLDAVIRQHTFDAIDVATAPSDTAALERSLAGAAQREADARRALAEERRVSGPSVAALVRRIDIAVLLLQAQTLFATTGRFLVISGWIPEAQAPELEAAIARVTEGRAVVTVEKPDVAATASRATLGVPILYRNPLLLRPFQALVDLYGTPSYGELQPTAFFAISFLLMFGLMFGDVGHGAVLAAAGYWVFRYMPRFLDYGILLMEAGVASAVFGVLYGSVFGVEHWIPALWLHPIHDLTHFTRVAAAIGVVMISGGFLLGIVNTWRSGERAAALTGVRGLFGAFAYWTVAAVAARMLLPAGRTVSGGLIAVLCAGAAALLILRPLIVRFLAPHARVDGVTTTPLSLRALEASIEIVDALVAYFANTISFVRVAAFAAVHAAVLVAVFAMADTLARYQYGGTLSIFVLVGGNVLTILLEGLTVTVQVLRLEYYEFFGKFFLGGGQPYRPLMLGSTGAEGEA